MYARGAAALTNDFQDTVRTQAKEKTRNKTFQPTLSSVTFTYDTAPPTSTISFPASGAFYNASGCTGSLTGSASDPGTHPSGFCSVGVSIKRLSDNLYWNGSAFSSATEVFNTATGTSSWSYALAASALSDNTQYTVRSQANDFTIHQNPKTTPSPLTSPYHTAPPTSSISFPASGAFYNAA